MTNYQRMQIDKDFCASVLSSALHSGEYEADDFDPAVMKFLDTEQREVTDERKENA